MATNELLPFANGEDANVLPTAQWQVLTDILQNGFQSGIARSEQVNRVLAQGAVASYVLGQLIVDQLNQNATLDEATLYQNLVSALQETAKDVCLPFGGGTLTGELTVSKYLKVSSNSATEGGEVQLFPPTGYTDYGKISIDYWQNSFRVFNLLGTSLFRLEQDNTNASCFGQLLERVVAQGTNYIRYYSGLQICWVKYLTYNATWTFPVEFKEAPVVLTLPYGSGANPGIHEEETTTTYTKVYNGSDWSKNIVAIGRWK